MGLGSLIYAWLDRGKKEISRIQEQQTPQTPQTQQPTQYEPMPPAQPTAQPSAPAQPTAQPSAPAQHTSTYQPSQQEELRHPVTGAIGARTPEGDIVYGPLAEQLLAKQQQSLAEVQQQQNMFQQTLDGYQLAGFDIPAIPDFREDIGWLKDQMTKSPAIPDLRTEMERLRQQYQVEPLEAQISDYDRQLVDAQQKYSELLAQEKGRPVTLEVMRGRTGEIEEMMRQEIGFLEARKAVTVQELNQKYNTINMMMGLTVQQYELARQDYEMKFSQAFNLLGLMMDNERYQFDTALNMAKTKFEIDQIQRQTAMANWQVSVQVIQEAINMGSMESFGDLTSEQIAQITRMETEAGLPSGFTTKILQNLRPREEMVSATMSQDQTMMSILMRQPDDLMRIVNLSTGFPKVHAKNQTGKDFQTASSMGLTSSAQQKTDFRAFVEDFVRAGVEPEQMNELWKETRLEWDQIWDRLSMNELLIEVNDAYKRHGYTGFIK